MTAPTLTEFLLARIAEDKALALAVTYRPILGQTRAETPPWQYTPVYDYVYGDVQPITAEAYASEIYDSEQENDEAVQAHAEAWWPGRVLAECEAKRRLIEMWAPDYLPELSILAQPYASHPDYQKEWTL